MKRYQLAKIVSWAETLHTRKRLQKVVFMLQAAGCPLEAGFYLHHYGPYSEEVARLTDELVRLALFEESATGNGQGQQYSYRLTAPTVEKLSQLESSERGQAMLAELTPYEELARRLLQADLRDLEVAATLLYFRRQGDDWSRAVETTCGFKGVPAGGPLLAKAEALARSVEASARQSAA
jgi:uncharacterized protein YwgA